MNGEQMGGSVEGRLTAVAERLGVPNDTVQITQVRLNRLATEPELEDERADAMAAAALALSCREDCLPVSDREIVEAWTAALEADGRDERLTTGDLAAHLETVAAYLDVAGAPDHPYALIESYGDALEMDDGLVAVAQRLLRDVFEAYPTVVTGNTPPSGTTAAVLAVVAEINERNETYDKRTLGNVSGAGAVTVRNRVRELREVFDDDGLAAARYRLGEDGTATAPETAADAGQQAVADGKGDGDAAAADAGGEPDEPAAPAPGGDPYVETVRALYPDELPTTASVAAEHDAPEADVEAALADLAAAGTLEKKPAGTADVWLPADEAGADADLTADAVESEVDALADELSIDPAVRLFARGMVSDAADDVAVGDAGELAAAALVAGARTQGGDVDAADVAAVRDFEVRAIVRWLDRLADAVDVDVPRLGADDVVEKLVDELDLSDTVAEESRRALDLCDAEADGADGDEYTARELAGGAVFFAATVDRTQVDVGELAAVAGADPQYVTDAMNSVVVSLCLGLVRGDVDYEECAWTDDLLESELSSDIGDSDTGRVITVAKIYAAGREGDHLDDGTLDVVLPGE